MKAKPTCNWRNGGLTKETDLELGCDFFFFNIYYFVCAGRGPLYEGKNNGTSVEVGRPLVRICSLLPLCVSPGVAAIVFTH